jgi:hypothetical protein
MAIKRNLFTSDIYIFDMSSLKELHDRYPKNLFPTIWENIASLIQNEQLHSHIEIHRVTIPVQPAPPIPVEPAPVIPEQAAPPFRG